MRLCLRWAKKNYALATKDLWLGSKRFLAWVGLIRLKRMNYLWQICWLEGLIGYNRFAGLKEWAGSNGFARCTSKISPQKQIWRLEGMKIDPWPRICWVSKNILLATNFLSSKYCAEAKVLQHYTGNFEHAVWKLLKHPGLSIPNAMVWAKISKKDACCQQNCALGHRAVRKLQDRVLYQNFNLHDNNNQTFYIQCNNQL